MQTGYATLWPKTQSDRQRWWSTWASWWEKTEIAHQLVYVSLLHILNALRQFRAIKLINRFPVLVSISAHIMQIFQRRQQMISEDMVKGYLKKHIQTIAILNNKEYGKNFTRSSAKKKIGNKNWINQLRSKSSYYSNASQNEMIFLRNSLYPMNCIQILLIILQNNKINRFMCVKASVLSNISAFWFEIVIEKCHQISTFQLIHFTFYFNLFLVSNQKSANFRCRIHQSKPSKWSSIRATTIKSTSAEHTIRIGFA